MTAPRQVWPDGPGGFIPRVEKQRAKEQRQAEIRRQFLTPRPDGIPAPAITSRVPWLSEIPPDRMLGSDCKALDDIRMQSCCWITCERVGDHFVFKLEGEKEQDIRAAAERLSHIQAQAEAKRFQADSLHIIDVADDLDLPRVRTEECFGNSGESVGKLAAFVTLATPVTFFKDTGKDAMESLLEQVEAMASRSRYYRSNLSLRIHLGRFAMTRYPGNVAEFDYAAFQDMVDSDELEASVTDEMGDSKTQSTLLQRVSQATHFLAPSHTLADLEHKPIYAATLKLDDPGQRGQLMVDLEFSYDAGSTTVTHRRWYRTEPNRAHTRRLLDVNMVNLSRGFAWHIEMTATKAVDESTLPKEYRNFPETLSINTKSQDFVVVPLQGNQGAAVPLLSVSQKRIWRFETQFGYWAVDVVEGYGEFDVGRRMAREKPKWSLSVVNSWHEHLLESNAHVKVGELADWGNSGDPISELFPSGFESQCSEGDTDYPGLVQLLRLLHGLHDVVVVDGSASS
ncbi:hypothetical protein IWX90DRAFT_221447 [Phyllosticta citrichinensis]|uniref:DUF7905 domain-containing protein n=1 Tax=Phyllosticta citrichinensis TaxID=1130410 RepID=A0ABR1XU06_9PEZI